MVVVRLVYFSATMLNVPVASGGISREFSPREIVTGKRFDTETQCRALFGEYIEASEDADITNDMSHRTQPCIALGPSGNIQGSIVCFQVKNAKIVRTLKGGRSRGLLI